MPFDFATVTRYFFDSPAVLRAMDRATRRVQSRQGAFIRQRARTSIRRRKKSSPAGQPPSAHVAGGIKLIFFSWDPATESTVVGPVPTAGTAVAPGLLERGGEARRQTRSGAVRLHYRGNPFMAPAERAERPKFAALYRNSLR